MIAIMMKAWASVFPSFDFNDFIVPIRRAYFLLSSHKSIRNMIPLFFLFLASSIPAVLMAQVAYVTGTNGISVSATPSFNVTVSGSNTLVVVHVFMSVVNTDVEGTIGGNPMNQVNRTGVICAGLGSVYECTLYYAGLAANTYSVVLTSAGPDTGTLYYQALVYSNVNQVTPVGISEGDGTCFSSSASPSYGFGTTDAFGSLISGMFVATSNPVITAQGIQTQRNSQVDGSNNYTQEVDDQQTTAAGTYTMSYSVSPGQYYFYEAIEIEASSVQPTNTPTNTSTATATNTPTDTATETITNTVTDTATGTMTNTVTDTATDTASSTSTDTATATSSNTATNTTTDTAVNTFTFTNTQTNTSTNTATGTATNTATNTTTDTALNTNTFTNTATNTVTNTATQTATNTVTNSATNTATNTPVDTNTSTNTPTNTATSTVTSTPTFTPQATSTSTLTMTPTATITPIIPFTIYPNPYNGAGPLMIHVPLSAPGDIHVSIFTLVFRKIAQQDFLNQPVGLDVSIQLKDKSGFAVANGLYYVRVAYPTGQVILKLLVLR